MMYLDSLGSTSENVRIERSAEFRRQVSFYHEMLDYSDKISVPEQLGGILADDMGLGKTLQATALMLDEKRSKGGEIREQSLQRIVISYSAEGRTPEIS